MNTLPKWVWVVVVLVVLIGGWMLLKDKPAPVDGPVKVGVVLPLTGDAAVYGEPLANVIRIAAEDINAAGGVNGNPIELIVEDGKCDGAAAANAAQKLVNVDHVKVIIGGFCSSESLSMVPIAEAGKVAMISPGSSSPKLTDISKYFVRNYPSDSTQGDVLANIAYTDKGWKKVAFIQEQTDYALGVYTAFSDKFTELGGATTNESFPTENTDFRSIVTKVQGQSPDAVFISVQTPAVATRILTQMSQLGWKPNIMVSDTVPGDPDTVEQNKAILEGALAAEFGVDKSNPKFSEIIGAYKAKYGEEPPYQSYAQTVYDSVYLVRDAVAAAGYDGTKIAQWLRNVKDWQGAAGVITIGDNGDPLIGHRAEVIMGGKVGPYSR